MTGFFRSRWVEAPIHAGEIEDTALPRGFRAAGVTAGLKPEGLDVGVLASDSPETVSAARFTTNARVGAPVTLSREADLSGLRAVAVNSGCSNVGDGARGLETAAAMQSAAASKLGLEADQVGVASTGVIGVELPREPVVEGVRAACDALELDAGGFSEAILTSDRGPKRACLQVHLPSGESVRLAAQAKGAGMISPSFATTLCFVETDAALAAETLDLLLGVCIKRSFDRISVDGQLSTSDSVFALASGASGVRVEPEGPAELALGEALDALLRQLALDIVADGEGAARVGRVVVSGRPDAVEPVARAVANSPLVKTALHGGDPNFGRVLQAAGQAWPAGEAFVADLEIEDRLLVSAGDAVGLAASDLSELSELVRGPEVEYRLTLPGEGGETEVFFSDLSPAYVEFNSSLHELMRDIGTLLEALPYIREFHGETVVIKYGGAAMTEPELKEEFARDVVLLKYVGLNPVVVHGGGPDITAYMDRLGMEVRFVDGMRVSDEATVEVVKMVLVGKQNKDIVLRLGRHGQPAVGLCGDDGRLFTVTKRVSGETDMGFVGDIERVDADVLNHIAEDYIPVIASVGADLEGNSYNVNADLAAAAVARALEAFKVIFLTDVDGWRADPDDPSSRISEATAEEVRKRLGEVGGGMRPKLEACLQALEAGVDNAHIIDGRTPHSLLLELFTDEGIGTKLWP